MFFSGFVTFRGLIVWNVRNCDKRLLTSSSMGPERTLCTEWMRCVHGFGRKRPVTQYRRGIRLFRRFAAFEPLFRREETAGMRGGSAPLLFAPPTYDHARRRRPPMVSATVFIDGEAGTT